MYANKIEKKMHTKLGNIGISPPSVINKNSHLSGYRKANCLQHSKKESLAINAMGIFSKMKGKTWSTLTKVYWIQLKVGEAKNKHVRKSY